MKTQQVFSASAAAVLALTIAASTGTAQQAEKSKAPAVKQPAADVTVVGCIQREADYRKANSSGRGGPAGTGLGLGNEFVLVNASKVEPGAPPPASVDCATPGSSGEAYELTGSREGQLAKLVGKRVEITGTMKEAKARTDASGTAKPTGGFDPLKQDLRLFEVNVASFREAPVGQQAAVTQQAAPSPAPRAAEPAPRAVNPPPVSPAPEPRPGSAEPALPRTASPLPLAGLTSLLSIAGALGIRFMRRRS